MTIENRHFFAFGIYIFDSTGFSPVNRSASILIGRGDLWPVQADTIPPMRKEDLDRRSDELKVRMLAARNEAAQKKPRSVGARESDSRAKPSERAANVPGEISSDELAEVTALKKQVAQLIAENESLRRQLASTNYQAPLPSRSNDDSVREQRHNFFKYSNIRRY